LTFFPRLDGITLGMANAGDQIAVATTYGGVYQAPSDQGWIPGGTLYVGPNGILTQDFSSISFTCYWIIVMGRAVDSHSFIYEPNLPSSIAQTF
jgi:hypothetical protein